MPRVKIIRPQTIKHNGVEYTYGKNDEFTCTDEEFRVLRSTRSPLVTEIKSVTPAPVVKEEPADEPEEEESTEEEVKAEKKPAKKPAAKKAAPRRRRA